MRIILFFISIPAKLLSLLGRGYNRLSNRVIALLILLLTVPLIGYGLYFVFGLNIGSVTFVSIDPEKEFSLRIEKGGVSMIERVCLKECIVEWIPASTYKVTLNSAGKKEIVKELKIQRGDSIRETLVWETSLAIQKLLPTKLSEIIPSVTVESEPIRLLWADKKIIYQSPTAIAYSTGSLAYGYFMSVLPNGTYDIVHILTGESFVLAPSTTPTVINYIKPLGSGDSYIVSTKWDAYIYSHNLKSFEPLTLYDDLVITPQAQLIALVRAESTLKREILGLNSREGDLILDVSRVGIPQILKDKLSNTRALFLSKDTVFLEDTFGNISTLTLGE